jgi:hypothetical protein
MNYILPRMSEINGRNCGTPVDHNASSARGSVAMIVSIEQGFLRTVGRTKTYKDGMGLVTSYRGG